ncbi:cytochrome c oxidase subunit 6b-3-like [Prunus yedoensis var. nudiflora]|uniref:Cytochrome c oxidase subunit 6b-3-like n=1 Tax=Prunus yedoensis var. nudiflora TaxID=2094558 RepID=A0A314Z143_PRUYE|nr:cytochrome c oxidase subunit 6b-3-like [Prunus yedoensis var. nudiflora]
MSAASQVDPHNEMRARDVNKVARGEQAPRPAHEYGSINSTPPKPKPKDPAAAEIKVEDNPPARHCYASYVQYYKCIKEEGKAPKCERFEKNYRRLCPVEWIEKWDEEQKLGVFAGPI